jgi:nitrite reductase/ring-hydroxylating ferredoxin subunit
MSEPEARPKRRDFLGLAAAWAFLGALGVTVLGSLRLYKPAVFPEASSSFKAGWPKDFLKGTVTPIPGHRVWIFCDNEGLYAISAVCPHLGCMLDRKEDGRFSCPCHGSIFDARGNVVKGPATRPMAWPKLSLAPGGQLVVDMRKTVKPGTRLRVS